MIAFMDKFFKFFFISYTDTLTTAIIIKKIAAYQNEKSNNFFIVLQYSILFLP